MPPPIRQEFNPSCLDGLNFLGKEKKRHSLINMSEQLQATCEVNLSHNSVCVVLCKYKSFGCRVIGDVIDFASIVSIS
jgi:hypothetical protein